jgi:hypothetical protein
MLCYRKRLLRIVQLWYADPVPPAGVDVVVFNQAPEPLPGVRWTQKATRVLDLTKPEATLLAEMKKASRAKIKNARDKDGVTCVMVAAPTADLRNQFYAFYDRFARAKGLSCLDRVLMEQMARQGQLAISSARTEDVGPVEDPLVFHAHLIYGGRARALYSASSRLEEHDPERRSLIGRANHLLHWEDIRWSRAGGQRLYDFGGWYSGDVDAQRLAINQFKAGFGGETITEYEADHGVTLQGRLGVAIWKLLKGQ